MSPGWSPEWHVGIRDCRLPTKKPLVAFISAVPVNLRVRNNIIRTSEVNFLCVHKKLRNKRLTPILIKEVTRRSNLQEIWQGVYTAGIVLPKPVSTCRYYHRALDWKKLYDIGFSPLPPNSKPEWQIRKYTLPEKTATKGLREMTKKDVPAVHKLMKSYVNRFDMAPEWDEDEVAHWLLQPRAEGDEQVVWSYVVEVRETHTNKLPLTHGSTSSNPFAFLLIVFTGRESQNHRLLLLLQPRVHGHQQPAAQGGPSRLPLLLRH